MNELIRSKHRPRPLLAGLSFFLLLVAAVLPSGPASARPRIVIDFAGESGAVATTGDSWVLTSNATVCGFLSPLPASCGVSFDNNASVETKLGFQVKIGALTYDSLFMNKNGFVTFGSASTGNFAAAASIPAVQQVVTVNGTVNRPFIAPLYRQMDIPDVTTSFAPFGGGASYFRASGDPLAPFNAAERVPAFAVTWIDSDFNVNPQIMTQLVLYSAGANGDFYLRLRYGQSDTDQFTGLAGGSLVTATPGNVFQLASTLGGATANLNDYFFVFRNGNVVPSLDPDADGLLDGVDNCRQVPNPDQCDSDGDGYGNRCDGDLNNNTFVNAQDTTLFRAQLGQASVAPAFNEADLNCNGAVNAQDTTLLRGFLGSAPGPSGFKP